MFERFEFKGTRGRDSIVSIYNTGVIAFSSTFSVKNNIGRYKYIELYYNKEDHQIGIKFIKKQDDNSFGLTKRGNIYTTMIRSFLKHYGIDFSKPKKYSYTFDEAHGMYIINLKYKE